MHMHIMHICILGVPYKELNFKKKKLVDRNLNYFLSQNLIADRSLNFAYDVLNFL